MSCVKVCLLVAGVLRSLCFASTSVPPTGSSNVQGTCRGLCHVDGSVQ